MEVFLYSMREYILDSVGSTAYWVTLWWGRCIRVPGVQSHASVRIDGFYSGLRDGDRT